MGVLAAAGRCIARHGIDGATLEKVAVESSMSRSHVRHYVGNRADLFAVFRSRILKRYAPPDLAEAQAADLDDYAAYARIEAFVAEAIKADNPQWSELRVATTASQVLMLTYGHATLASVGLASARLGGACSRSPADGTVSRDERLDLMTVHISLAGQDEIPACARLIAEALRDDPVVRHIVRGDRDPVERLTVLYSWPYRMLYSVSYVPSAAATTSAIAPDVSACGDVVEFRPNV